MILILDSKIAGFPFYFSTYKAPFWHIFSNVANFNPPHQPQVTSLQDQLEKGPNAQLARLQQENSILRDALNQATSQAESKSVAPFCVNCTKVNLFMMS